METVVQNNAGMLGGLSFLMFGCLSLAVAVMMLVAMWKVFEKAGQPGWGFLIPIYNAYLLCKIAGKPGWWLLLLFIPLVNVVIGILLAVCIAERFGRSIPFAVGLIVLPFVFYPILGFGESQYTPAASA